MHNKSCNFIPADYFFSIPAAYLALGLFGGILTANNFSPLFAVQSNIIVSAIIIVLLLLINKKSKEFSIIAAFLAGFFLQNSWQTSQKIGENIFNDGEKTQIFVEFYSPPNFRSEKEMTQLATISGSDYRINLILTDTLTNFVIIPGERAKITGVFRKFDTKNTAAPWEYDNIFQDRIKNSIGEIEAFSVEKSVKNPVAVKLHHYIRKKFEGTQYNSFYVSLFLGDRSFVTQETRAFFRESGLVHFLSISGMHIAIFIFAFLGLASVLPLPFLLRKVIVAALILCLPLVVGFGPATLRAVIMGNIFLLSPLFNRKNNAINSLFFAMFLILAIYPAHFFLIGFQYSFSATFGILILLKILENRKYKNTAMFFIMPIFMFLLTSPIQIFHFGTLTLSSPICNLFLLPFLAIVCKVAFAALLIGIVAPAGSQLLLNLTDEMLNVLMFTINEFVVFTGLGEDYTSISPFFFIGVILIIMVFFSFRRQKIIFAAYTILAIITVFLISDLLKKDAIYTISSQNFRMKLFDGKNPTAVILGGAQTKLYDNPAFRRWVNTRLNSGFFVTKANPVIITDESYVPTEFLRNYKHIILKNTTGEIKFDCEDDAQKTKIIAPEEKKQRRVGVAKEFWKN